MCGIFGYITRLPSTERSKLRSLIEKIGELNTNRGFDAHGIAFFDDLGTVTVQKGPGSIYSLFRSKEWKNLPMPEILIGHTRSATKGEPTKNENNHPLSIGDFTVVHNGVIMNDEDLFKKHDLERLAEVDSEVIPSLISKTAKDDPQLLNVEVLEKCLGKLIGSHACGMIDQRETNNLYLWRSSSPCTLAYVPDLQTIFFSSTEYPLEQALKKHDAVIGGLEEQQGVIISNKAPGLTMENIYFETDKTNFEEWLQKYRRENANLMKDKDENYGLAH